MKDQLDERRCSIIDNVLSKKLSDNVSDIHIKSSGEMYLRENGIINLSDVRTLRPNDIDDFIRVVLNEKQKTELFTKGNIDIALQVKSKRYRANIYSSNRSYNIAFRVFSNKAIPIEKLGLTSEAIDTIKCQNGLILVTGKTGSGKSTTLNSIVNEINNKDSKHIITIEDPIEFEYESNKSIITQIELNKDINSFGDAVISSLRQDPDVIVIGEMRDQDTMRAALTASETGHLVISTLHTNSASESVDRIVQSFDGNEQNQVRYLLSRNIRMSISQELSIVEGKRQALFEIMIATDAIRNMIRQNKTYLIENEIVSGRKKGMISKEKYQLKGNYSFEI